ncbi:hypothetical protein Pint_08831 [Pistacia integerrima]|uniref:Uncharacterized protein n=1 Tax=Pistacia integerrima TaxID=434235 RepID=A0ACC0XUU1_9ROSI|nr:hypothetical protein Pint_08831 [Pistacia integerrima]
MIISMTKAFSHSRSCHARLFNNVKSVYSIRHNILHLNHKGENSTICSCNMRPHGAASLLRAVLRKLLRASSLVSFSMGSDFPVSKFTLETGFFNNSSATFDRLFKFCTVEISTEDKSPFSVSS